MTHSNLPETVNLMGSIPGAMYEFSISWTVAVEFFQSILSMMLQATTMIEDAGPAVLPADFSLQQN
jgi:hypothetical protein